MATVVEDMERKMWKLMSGCNWSPAIGNRVEYVPLGHAEYSSSALAASVLFAYTGIEEMVVVGAALKADDITDECFAAITLASTYWKHNNLPDLKFSYDDASHFTFDVEDYVRCVKTITAEDLSGGFCYLSEDDDDGLFGDVDVSSTLAATDVNGVRWSFEISTHEGRKALGSGWETFSASKLLQVGDSVVFVGTPNGEVIIGLRRSPPSRQRRRFGDRISEQSFAETVESLLSRTPFTVIFYPSDGYDFVLPRGRAPRNAMADFSDCVGGRVIKGIIPRRCDPIGLLVQKGLLVSVAPPSPFDGKIHSPWRMLEVKWDGEDFTTREHTWRIMRSKNSKPSPSEPSPPEPPQKKLRLFGVDVL